MFVNATHSPAGVGDQERAADDGEITVDALVAPALRPRAVHPCGHERSVMTLHVAHDRAHRRDSPITQAKGTT
jgi:hypothetical protein